MIDKTKTFLSDKNDFQCILKAEHFEVDYRDHKKINTFPDFSSIKRDIL